jgi:hypothetical protein
MATWKDVQRLAGEFPDTEESTVYRRPAYKVHGKSFAWMSPHEEGALVTRVDPDELPFLLATKQRSTSRPHTTNPTQWC